MRGRALALAHATHTTLGPRGRGNAIVGATFSFQSIYMHTVSDRAEAVRNMALDATRLYTTIASAIGVIPVENSATRIKDREAKGQPAAWYQWWVHSAEPVFTAWAKFKSAQIDGEGRDGFVGDYLSWTNRFTTDWSSYTDWAKRLDAVLKGAELLGIVPKDTPGVAPLPTTAIEDVANTIHDAGHDAYAAVKKTGNIAEIAAYSALGLGAVLVVTSIVQNVRQGKDPVGSYVSYARRR